MFIIFALVNLGMLVPIFLFYIGKIHFPHSEIVIVFGADKETLSETANKHLEDLDLLFAGESNIAWRAEREFDLAKSKTNEIRSEEMNNKEPVQIEE